MLFMYSSKYIILNTPKKIKHSLKLLLVPFTKQILVLTFDTQVFKLPWEFLLSLTFGSYLNANINGSPC